MHLLFWRKHGQHKKEQLDAIEKAATQTHQENISNIVKTRKDAVTLKKVLEKNNITIGLAKAIGH